jgi:putative transposase
MKRIHLINYIKNQEAHHEKVSFKEEYMALMEKGVVFDEKYLL